MYLLQSYQWKGPWTLYLLKLNQDEDELIAQPVYRTGLSQDIYVPDAGCKEIWNNETDSMTYLARSTFQKAKILIQLLHEIWCLYIILRYL